MGGMHSKRMSFLNERNIGEERNIIWKNLNIFLSFCAKCKCDWKLEIGTESFNGGWLHKGDVENNKK